MRNKILGIFLLSFVTLFVFLGCGEVVKQERERGEGTTTTTTTQIIVSTTTTISGTTTISIPTTITTTTTISTTTTTTTTTLPQLNPPAFESLPGTGEDVGRLITFLEYPLSSADIYYTTDGSVPDPSDTVSTKLYNPATGFIITTSTTVSAIAVAEGFANSEVLVGEFTLIWWQEVGGGVNGPIRSMAFDDSGNLYVGGSFTLAGDVPVENIAMWDGQNWHPLADGLNGTVYSLAITGPYLYAGGSFRGSGPNDLSRIARWNIDSGGWQPLTNGFDDTVFAVFPIPGGGVVAGGSFLRDGADTKNLRRIAYWNGADWYQVTGGISGEKVNALAYDGSSYYAGGAFFEVGDPPLDADNIASFAPDPDPVFWFIPEFDWTLIGDTNDNVRALLYLNDGRLIVGGDFSLAGGIVAGRVAAYNTATSNWLPLGEFNRRVRALANDDGAIYAGGDFRISGSGVDEVEVNHIARFNYVTRGWDPLGTGLDGGVNAIVVNNGNVYAGGFFDHAGGVPAVNIAFWGIK